MESPAPEIHRLPIGDYFADSGIPYNGNPGRAGGDRTPSGLRSVMAEPLGLSRARTRPRRDFGRNKSRSTGVRSSPRGPDGKCL